jgi:type II secretory pathway predicted ATPase ExeA
MRNPTPYLKVRVLGAIDMAPGNTIRARIQAVSQMDFTDEDGHPRRFTWRTIQTGYSRYQKHGVTVMENKPRADKGKTRKLQPEVLLEAVRAVWPKLHGKTPKRATLYRLCIEQGLLTRGQVAPNTFSRLVKEYEMLKPDAETNHKIRLAFAKARPNDSNPVPTQSPHHARHCLLQRRAHGRGQAPGCGRQRPPTRPTLRSPRNPHRSGQSGASVNPGILTLLFMIRSHFGLQRNPFDTESVTLLDPQQQALDILKVHAQQGGLCLVLGEPGTGKTILKEALVHLDPKRIITPVVNRTLHTYHNTLRILCQAFAIEFEGHDHPCERRLVEEAFRLHRAGKMLVPIIDDAHLMQAECLRKLRLLFENFPRSHNLVLIGQPSLLQTLSLIVNEEIRSRVTYFHAAAPPGTRRHRGVHPGPV